MKEELKRMSTIPLTKCPKCGGQMFEEADKSKVCIQCGYTKYPEPVLARIVNKAVR